MGFGVWAGLGFGVGCLVCVCAGVWCSVVVRVVSIVVVFNDCSVQLFVLCQLLQCSIVECVKLLQCSIVVCVVSVVVVFNCCSVQLCLFLLHFVFTSHVPICLQF